MSAEQGLLLVNLGTPRSTDLNQVRAFLREFLMDGKVITLPYPLRWLLVNRMIVPKRAPLSKWKYERIWMKEGSPLLVHSLAFLDRLRPLLGPGVRAEMAMRYGEPSMAAALDRLAGVGSLTVVPLFPQHAEATTGSVFARLDQLLASRPALRRLPQRRVRSFHLAPFFIQAYARGIRARMDVESLDHFLFSFHGLPIKDVLRSSGCRRDGACCAVAGRECYRSQAMATAKALAQELGLKDGRWGWAFQSRLGKTEWIKPYFSETVEALARQGVKRLGVACPSFVADCLETLEEIGIDNQELFRENGGRDYLLAPCPNADEGWVGGFARWIGQQMAPV